MFPTVRTRLGREVVAMLIRFSVQNFKSFKEQAVLTMAATKGTRHSSHIFAQEGNRILKGSFLFGANASGKSNFIQAMSFARDVVLHGVVSRDTSRKHFRLEDGQRDKPGVFQFDFMVGESQYSYGFAISYRTHSIVAEWLAKFRNETSVYIFNREVLEDGTVKIETEYSPLPKEDANRFYVYVNDYKVKKNIHLQQTFMLADIAQRVSEQATFFSAFTEAYTWLKNLVFIFPSTRFTGLGGIAFDDTKRKVFEEALQFFDTGIQGVTKQEVPFEKMKHTLSPAIIKKIKLSEVGKPLVLTDGNRFIHLERQDAGDVVIHQMLLNHGLDSEMFESIDESDGTRRLFDLIPLLMLSEERVIIVDEIDRSLHSKVLEAFIKKFYERTEQRPIQLIATTHDSNVLNLSQLRQDEIWFVERQEDSSSRLYSLSEFKERFDRNIEREYLLGRYGAIPLFKEWEQNGDA